MKAKISIQCVGLVRDSKALYKRCRRKRDSAICNDCEKSVCKHANQKLLEMLKQAIESLKEEPLTIRQVENKAEDAMWWCFALHHHIGLWVNTHKLGRQALPGCPTWGTRVALGHPLPDVHNSIVAHYDASRVPCVGIVYEYREDEIVWKRCGTLRDTGICGACIVTSGEFVRENELQKLQACIQGSGPPSQAALDYACTMSNFILVRRQRSMRKKVEAAVVRFSWQVLRSAVMWCCSRY